MARKTKKPLALARGERHVWPDAELWFHADFALLEWRATPGEELDPITIVGDSSMIPQYDRTWDFDGRNTLRVMSHHCGRLNIVDRGTIADLVHPWLDAGDSFELQLVTKPSGKITSETWLSDPLDLAVIGFAPIATSGPSRIEDLFAGDIDAIRIAPDVTFALDRASGELRWILAQDVGRRFCSCYAGQFTREQHGDELLQALARLYVECTRASDRVETKHEFRKRTAHLVTAALGAGRRQEIDLGKAVDSLLSDRMVNLPEYVIPPKLPPRR